MTDHSEEIVLRDSRGGCLEPQGGLLNLFSGDMEQQALDLIENFIAVGTALWDAKTNRQAAAIIFLYIKTHYHKSVLGVVKDYLLECGLFSTEDYPDTSVAIPEEYSTQGGLDDWLTRLKDVKSNWTILQKSPAFTKISKLISMAAALGLCNLANFSFEIGGLRLFSLPALNKHMSATNFFGACFDTIVFFLQGGYECFKSRSFNPLLFEDSEAQEFEDNFFKAQEYSNMARCGNLEKMTGMKENDYSALLDKLVDQSATYMKACPQGFERKIISDRHATLRKIRADFRSYRVSGKMREAPYAYYLWGGSSVGKSYVSALLSRVLLMANDFAATDDKFIVLNEADKYLSTADSSINCVVIDDIGNPKSEYVQVSPAQLIIWLVNNVAYYANMAEVELKGKISLEPKCVALTSNVDPQALAETYSNNQLSVVRRFIHIKQRVRPEFCLPGTEMLDGAKVRAAFGDDPYPDAYLFDVRKARGINDEVSCDLVMKEGCSLAELIDYVVKDSRAHFENQRFLVKNSTNLSDRIELCDECHRPKPLCACGPKPVVVSSTPHGVQPESGYERTVDRRNGIDIPLCDDWVCKVLNYFPDFAFNNLFVQLFATFLQWRRLKQQIWLDRGIYLSLLFVAVYVSLCNILFGMCAVTLTCYIFLFKVYQYHVALAAARAQTRGQMPSLITIIKQDKFMRILGTCAALGVFYKVIKYSYEMWRLTQQGSLTPASEEEIKARDSEANPWVGTYISPVPKKDNIRCSHEELCGVLQKNITYMRCPNHPEGVSCSDAIFLKTGKVLIPNHMVYADTMLAEFYSAASFDASLGEMVPKLRKRAILSKETSYRLPGSDWHVFAVPSAGPWADISKYLPDGNQDLINGAVVYRGSDGDVKTWKVSAKFRKGVRIGKNVLDVYEYNMPEGTFKGLCMAALISNTNPSYVAGFHLGGNGFRGAAAVFTKSMFNEACSYIDSKTSVLDCHSNGDFPVMQYDVQVLVDTKIHHNSCLNYLPDQGSMEVFGTTVCKAKHTKSDVVPTLITNLVEKHCGVPNEWGPPKMHRWKPFWQGIQKTSEPSLGFDPADLEWACNDYLEPLLEVMRNDYWQKETKPLTFMQTLCGIDGKRFVEPIPKKTSVGFPLSGPKEDHMIRLDPEEYPDFSCPLELDKMFVDEFHRVKAVYLSGERAYPIFKAALKDEVTKLTKEKVRVFFAAPLVLQLFVRMYYLPICRFMSINPLLSECAVGINAVGPEWDQLAKHMMKFGENRILAGDYSSYDTRMPAQVTTGGWNCMIELAKASGNYTDDDITIMRGIATDCCYPVVAYNGDLIQFCGVHISGINVTAYEGSIQNSLQQRCGYHNGACAVIKSGLPNLVKGCVENGKIVPFRERAAMINYGDDCKGSVSELTPWFNHITYRDFLKAHDIVFTMPDKESEPVPYMSDSDADFLKRHNKFNTDVGLYCGALDKKSIYKSLHRCLKSGALTPQQHAAQVIDGALREMFYHGRSDYEEFRTNIRKVAEEAEVNALCLVLNETYDDRLQNFKETYLGETPKKEEQIALEEVEYDSEGGMEYKFADVDMLYIWAKQQFSTNPVLENDILGHHTLGEIDLLFMEYDDRRQRHYFVFEIKNIFKVHKVLTNSSYVKGKKQARKYMAAIAALQPGAHVHSFVVTNRACEYVASTSGLSEYLVTKYPGLPIPLHTIEE